MNLEHFQQSLDRRYNRLLLWVYRLSLPKKVEKIRKKERIDVLFILSELGPWKTESLYLAMLAHPRFNPVLGLVKSTEDTSFMAELQEYFEKKQYPYIHLKASNFGQPDIVFYQKPYDGTYPNNITVRYHLNSLFCYAAYGIHALRQRWSTNQPLHHFAWQLYYENELAATSGRSLMDNKGINIVVTGLPIMDLLLKPKEFFSDPWKQMKGKRKRIIFAPHHTIGEMHLRGMGISTFLDNADYLLELAERYSTTTQWAFKPHPLLRRNLEQIWGKKRTDDYYLKWETMENTQVETGEYIGLFKFSDAMIHDCSSFTIEYLYTKKPALYLVRNESHSKDLNEFAKAAYDMHYHAYQRQDIDAFLQNVLSGEDVMLSKRESFYNTQLFPPNGKSACENIINAILGD